MKLIDRIGARIFDYRLYAGHNPSGIGGPIYDTTEDVVLLLAVARAAAKLDGLRYSRSMAAHAAWRELEAALKPLRSEADR